jgi:macrolide transport system ATP-binding/permease protein
MSLLRSIAGGLRTLFRKAQVSQELDEELNNFLEMAAEEKMKQGMSRKDAIRAVRLERGSLEVTKEVVRSAGWESFVETLWQDLRFATRMLRKNPGFTATAVITLGLGIGLNSAIFSLFDALMLRALPVRDPNAVVNIYQRIQDKAGGYRSFSYPEYVALRESNDVFSGLVAFSWIPAEIETPTRSTADGAEEAQGLLVTADYFSLLGGGVAVGRTFLPEEDDETRGSHPIIVLSHGFWEQHFNSDRSIVGKSVKINGILMTVVGVASAGFVGTEPQTPDFWVPMMMQAQLMPGDDRLGDRGSFWLDVIARLKPGVSRMEAQTGMDVLVNRIASDYLGTNQKVSVDLVAGSFLARPDVRGQVNSFAFLMMASVAMILLIACANVANLSLARAAVRQKEMGVRLSLGASQGRLVQQLLTESLLVALLSGAAGLLLARWLPGALTNLFRPPYEHPINLPIVLDLPVLGYTLLLSLGTAVIFGLIPALRASRTNLSSATKGEITAMGRGSSRLRLHSLLVVIEISVCLVLLLGAGLLIRALGRAETIDPGFDMKHVLTLSMDLNLHGYNKARAAEFHRQLIERLQALPDVKEVAVASLTPLGGVSRAAPVTVTESNDPAGVSQTSVGYWVVSPNYFDSLSIPIVRGRSFGVRDTSKGPPVTIINEAMAWQFWPGRDPIGKRLRPGPASVPFTEVVGVVKNTRGARLWEADQPYVYLPILQGTEGPPIQTEQMGMKLLIRVNGNPDSLSTGVQRIVRALDPNVQVSAATLGKSMERWVWFSQVGAMLSSGLGLLGLFLASVGIYGVMSYSVTQRTHELGIRMALGADKPEILKLILRQCLGITLVGVAAGLLIALAVTRVIAAVLYGVRPTDPATFGGVSLLLTAIALLASYLPARRATRVDPMVALRYE